MTEWKEYDGSDEQIEELLTATHGFIVDSQDSVLRKPFKHKGLNFDSEFIKGHFAEFGVKYYLLCAPHPCAEMICQWARTGQPVWIKKFATVITVFDHVYGSVHTECSDEYSVHETNEPDWGIPGADYSFTPFEEEV